MAEIEILPQKIVDTRTIILKSRLDSNRARLQGEKLKTSFFVRFGFLKPKPKDILLVAFSKYYEPYILIGGKYSIDYCKRHNYALKVEDKTQEIFIDGKKLKPEPLSLEDNAKVIKLVGEEHSHYENETYLILDRMLQEVSPDNLFFAPFESEPENRPAVVFDLRKPQISLEEEITFLRSKIAKRPSDVAEIIREIFEINERIIIYSPVYELTYKNIKNGKNVTALINGVTGGVILGKFNMKASKKLEGPLEASPENLSVIKTRFFRVEPEQSQARDDSYVSNSTNKTPTENLIVEERVNNIAANSRQPEGAFRFNAENTTNVATDFMTRLGYKQSQFPTKLYVDGETDVVELKLQEGTARVQIDTKTKEVKEYEIQEAEARLGFLTSKRKLLLFLSSIVTIVVVLKLMNIF
jgi:hypothetical protein